MAFAPSCTSCSRFLSNLIDDVHQAGEHFSGGHIAVTNSDLRAADGHLNASRIVDLTLRQEALRILDDAGSLKRSSPAVKSVIYRTWLRWTGSAWTVVDWKRVVAE